MLTLILIILAVICFGARFFLSDGRVTAAGGLLLCIVLAIGLGIQAT